MNAAVSFGLLLVATAATFQAATSDPRPSARYMPEGDAVLPKNCSAPSECPPGTNGFKELFSNVGIYKYFIHNNSPKVL
jgi:hypothetical protein